MRFDDAVKDRVADALEEHRVAWEEQALVTKEEALALADVERDRERLALLDENMKLAARNTLLEKQALTTAETTSPRE